MSDYAKDLLRVSSRLLARRSGQKGPIRNAYVRRSISTTYYAIFHFLIADAASKIVGAGGSLQRRRRVFVRTFSHAGLTAALGKMKGSNIDPSIADLFVSASAATRTAPTPPFIRLMATTYLDAKAKREDADYNLNKPLSAQDASHLRRTVIRAIRAWEGANSASDRDAKHAVAILISAKGQLRA